MYNSSVFCHTILVQHQNTHTHRLFFLTVLAREKNILTQQVVIYNVIMSVCHTPNSTHHMNKKKEKKLRYSVTHFVYSYVRFSRSVRSFFQFASCAAAAVAAAVAAAAAAVLLLLVRILDYFFFCILLLYLTARLFAASCIHDTTIRDNRNVSEFCWCRFGVPSISFAKQK